MQPPVTNTIHIWIIHAINWDNCYNCGVQQKLTEYLLVFFICKLLFRLETKIKQITVSFQAMFSKQTSYELKIIKPQLSISKHTNSLIKNPVKQINLCSRASSLILVKNGQQRKLPGTGQGGEICASPYVPWGVKRIDEMMKTDQPVFKSIFSHLGQKHTAIDDLKNCILKFNVLIVF